MIPFLFVLFIIYGVHHYSYKAGMEEGRAREIERQRLLHSRSSKGWRNPTDVTRKATVVES